VVCYNKIRHNIKIELSIDDPKMKKSLAASNYNNFDKNFGRKTTPMKIHNAMQCNASTTTKH